MALVLADRVKETTTTAGTGTVSLLGAASGFRTFVAGVGDANTTYYTIVDGTAWEVGSGTVTDLATDTLSRVLIASSTGSLLVLSGGTCDVFGTLPGSTVVPAASPIFTGTLAAAAINASAAVNANLVTDATSISTGSLLTAGGLAVTKAAWIGGLMNVAGAVTLQSTLGVTGAITGNVTGNVSGSSGSTTGNAATVTTNANLTGPITSSGNATAVAAQTGTGSTFVMQASPALTTPNLGIPSSVVLTNASGTASININGTVGATTPAAATVTALTASSDSSFTSTGAVKIPASTTANRPSTGVTGQIRYNTSLNTFEGYGAASWGSIGGGATGAGGDTVFQENQLIVTTSYTLSTGKSAMSVGPITINSGAAVTIPSGYRWLVL